MTKRILIPGLVVALAVAAPATAERRDGDDRPGKSEKRDAKHGKSGDRAKSKSKSGKGQTNRCRARRVAYVARGTFQSAALTRNENGTYDGTIVIAVDKTNKIARAHRGTTQTYTLDDARVKFATADRDANGTVDATDARTGDRAKVTGKIARVAKKRSCVADPAAGSIKLRRATIAAPREAEQAPAPTS